MTLKKHVIMEHEGPKFQCDICERKMATEGTASNNSSNNNADNDTKKQP